MIAPQYRSGSRFSEGRAWVSDTYGVFARQQLIDSSGKIVRTSPFTLAQEFSHGLAATHRGFVNTEGEIVFSWEIATNEEGFSDGRAAVFEGKRVVFIDTTGNVVLRPSYESVGSYSEGLAPACVRDCGPSSGGQNWGYIDKTGNFVIRPRFGYKPGPFRDGLALVCFGCSG
jgi:hypothetical protein